MLHITHILPSTHIIDTCSLATNFSISISVGIEDSVFTQQMHGISVADGLAEISESLAEMIKYIANEPSSGLFYIQQHVQNAVPNIVNLRNSIRHKSYETALQIEDLDDSIAMIQSMKACGLPTVGQMMDEIKSSLDTIERKKARGSLGKPGSQASGSTWRMTKWGWGGHSSAPGNYFSNIFKGGKWKGEKARVPEPEQGLVGADELPLSSRVPDKLVDSELLVESCRGRKLSFRSEEDYDVFRADKAVKLQQWLELEESDDVYNKCKSGVNVEIDKSS